MIRGRQRKLYCQVSPGAMGTFKGEGGWGDEADVRCEGYEGE